MAAIRLTRTHRILIGIVVAGAVVIAAIGFAGSYAAVRTLALHRGFGWFANVFPIGVDAGIVVLLALDLLLTWMRIPFPLLRQTAWLLTAATIAFNGAAAWPDPLGVGMHAIIPVLFVVSVEAARHAIGRIADITADKHMESVRITRWLLAPIPTFRLWRRMKLWELRSYEEVIRREQDRLVYRARLRARYGVAWRRRAPIEAIMPLRLARYGVPLSDTADAGLEAAGIEVAPTTAKQLPPAAPASSSAPSSASAAEPSAQQKPAQARQLPTAAERPESGGEPEHEQARQHAEGPYGQQPYDPRYDAAFDPRFDPRYDPRYDPRFDPRFAAQHPQYGQYAQYDPHAYAAAAQNAQWNGQPLDNPWFQPPQFAQGEAELGPEPQIEGGPAIPGQEQPQVEQTHGQQAPHAGPEPQAGPATEAEAVPQVMVPAGPNRSRPLSGAQLNEAAAHQQSEPEPTPEPAQTIADELETYPVGGLQLPDDLPVADAYYYAYRNHVEQTGSWPTARHLARSLSSLFPGTPPEERELVPAIRELRYRYASEANAETIP